MSERSRGSGAGRGECDTACPGGSDGLCPSSNSPVPLLLLQHQPLGGGANVGGETAGGGAGTIPTLASLWLCFQLCDCANRPWQVVTPLSAFLSSCKTM